MEEREVVERENNDPVFNPERPHEEGVSNQDRFIIQDGHKFSVGKERKYRGKFERK